MKTKRITIARTINEFLGITPEQYAASLHVTLTDSRYALLRSFDTVLAYTASSVIVKRGSLVCEVEGENLQLFGLSEDTVRIEGSIFSVTYREAGR